MIQYELDLWSHFTASDVMLKLIEKGMTREEAYDLVQPKRAYSWDNQVDFKPLLKR